MISVISVAFSNCVVFEIIAYFIVSGTRFIASPRLQFHAQIFVFRGSGLEPVVYIVRFLIETVISHIDTVALDIAMLRDIVEIARVECVYARRKYRDGDFDTSHAIRFFLKTIWENIYALRNLGNSDRFLFLTTHVERHSANEIVRAAEIAN